jgi:hypothetical protein
MGLPTFTFCLFRSKNLGSLGGERFPDLPPDGVGFMTKWEEGVTWNKDPDALDNIANKNDITRLVYLDTWIKNEDRYFILEGGIVHQERKNVFFSGNPFGGMRYTLTAIDQADAFKCSVVDPCAKPGTLTMPMLKPHKCYCQNAVYGLFPEFSPRIRKADAHKCQEMLSKINKDSVYQIIESIPKEWKFNAHLRSALLKFILDRAEQISVNLFSQLFNAKHSQRFNFNNKG